MVGDDIDGELADGKQGDKSAVLEDDDVARIAGDAVIPAEEIVANVGKGFDLDGFVVWIAAATADGAPFWITAFDGDVV